MGNIAVEEPNPGNLKTSAPTENGKKVITDGLLQSFMPVSGK